MIALNTWFDLALEEAALVGDDPVVAGYGLGREVGGGPRRLDEVAGAVLAAHHPECRLEEFAERQARARIAIAEAKLDGLLLFKIEDMYWLTGFDSDGFVIFNNMFIGVDGQLTHVARAADLANIDYSSICDDVRISPDSADSTRPKAVKDMLESHGMAGRRIGIQVDTMGLTPRLYGELRAALDGWCELVDAPDLIRELRLVKSPQELDYLRKAGEIMDQVRDAAIAATQPDAFEGDIYGAIYGTLFRLGADLPAHIPPLGAGDAALNVRYTTARHHVGENDQVTHELGVAYRHYHAADMFVVLTGPKIDERHLKMHAACVEALDAVQARLTPGATMGEVYETHRATFAAHGLEHAILQACGYTMGATWPPTWMEQPMIVAGGPTVLEENMCFFTHMICTDQTTGLQMALGEQAIITMGKPEIITHVPREPIINNGG